MATNGTFQATGFEDLFKRLDALKEEIGKGKTDKIYRTAMKYAMEIVEQDAKSHAPRVTGQLQDHIYLKVHRPMARDKSGKAYAGEVYMARVTSSTLRDDTVYNLILNKRNKFQTVTSNKHPVPVSNEFGNARTPAHPFLRPALENNMDKIQSRLGWSLWQQIEKLATTGKV
jgi:HK97 gp10 family phage protein